jgi:hypothetical protein
MPLLSLHTRLNGYIVISRPSDQTLLKQGASLEGVFKLQNGVDYVLFSASRYLRFITSGAEELTGVLSPLINISS